MFVFFLGGWACGVWVICAATRASKTYSPTENKIRNISAQRSILTTASESFEIPLQLKWNENLRAGGIPGFQMQHLNKSKDLFEGIVNNQRQC